MTPNAERMNAPRTPRLIVLMGPTGAGKSTVGRALAESLGWPFLEGDDYHPAANIAKMAAGHPLDDADRAPWIAAIAAAVKHGLDAGGRAVLACSALRQSYRDAIAAADTSGGAVRFVYLAVPAAMLRERVEHRAGHFMPASLLSSQLATLEPPDEDGLTIDGTRPPAEIVATIRAALGV